MGLIKAGIGALGGTLADQWKEFFYCDALPNDVLMRRGQKQITGRSSNTKGNDNIISNGSGIAVADGQCMIIVDQGKIVEVCAEPGEYTFDTSSEPSIFSGKFGESLKESFKTLWKRFTYGGDTGKDQRVYYFNTKEILNNKFGTANPIMFEVVNKRIGMSRTVQVRCNGVYTYVISDPLVFYSRLCGNVATEFTRDEIDAQLKVEFVDALQPALGALAEQELRPAQIPAKANELKAAMNDALKQEWIENRGISVAKIALNPITLTEPKMTRFIMSLEEAVDLVLFAFEHGHNGDILVQKAPACTIQTQAEAVCELFGGKKEDIKVIGIRHGEKMYETLLTKEECAKAEDMGNFYRVPADNRGLNYDKFFKEGDTKRSEIEEFNSDNTYRLNLEETKAKIASLEYIQKELKGEGNFVQ